MEHLAGVEPVVDEVLDIMSLKDLKFRGIRAGFLHAQALGSDLGDVFGEPQLDSFRQRALQSRGAGARRISYKQAHCQGPFIGHNVYFMEFIGKDVDDL